MELSVSSPKKSILSSHDCMSEPEEHEISEEEDDDRNHKHRRKEETRSQSLDQDSSDQAFSRPYRKNYRHFENGNSLSEHEKRSLGGPSAQRVQFDNQRMRSNQMFPRDSGPGRGRGNYGSWTQRDSRFNPVDLSSHMVQVGSMAPGIFGGRGLAGVSAGQNAPWPAFGMLPGVPNGGLDGFHHLQGSLRPPLNAPLNMGIPRQRCRDFEERGFCLRGDMCPMEHGMNRIVVDDVQSLSQFNLPVSVPGAPHLAASSKPVPAQFGCTNFMNTKGAHEKINEGGMAVDGLGYGDAYPSVGGTDFYDPDQPLWNNSAGETSGALSALNSHGIDENVASVDENIQDGTENTCGIRDSKVSSQSVWGRMRGSSNSQGNFKGKPDAVLNSSSGLEDQLKEVSGSLSQHTKPNHVGESVTKAVDSSNTSNDVMSNTRKPAQKALRTLFVNGVPHECNRRDLILIHFQKFGKVIDIHIPINSDRAFVQFSKREEAESALRAPDAVMGNRFIKLWWANRDSIPDNGLSIANGSSMKGRGMAGSGGQNQLPLAAASKSNHASSVVKGSAFHTGGAPSSSDQPKPAMVTSGPKVMLLQQKKADTLERLKETLRKKQEMLEQKRNEFRKRLATLQKLGTVVRGEETDEPDTKRVKVDSASDSAATVASPKTESAADKKVHILKPLSTTILSTESPLPDPKTLTQRLHMFTSSVNAPKANRYKLDNRTTTIKVVPPLPTGLADVTALKEHFSSYGEVSKVEFEDNALIDSGKEHDTCNGNRAACVTFVKRSAAEKAFASAKCWQEHMLQLVWVTRQSNKENCSNNNTNPSVSGDHLPSSKNKCTSFASSGPNQEDRVIASSSMEGPEKANVSGDNTILDKPETKEGDNGNKNSNSESIERASEVTGTDEEQPEQMNG